MQIKQSRVDLIFDIINNFLMLIILFIMLYPLYFTIVASISEPSFVALGQVTILPQGFTWDAYKNVFQNPKIWGGYRVSLINTLIGVILNLILTIPTSYVLSKKRLHGRTFFSWYFLFTMYFGGGLIPSYLLIRSLNLVNKPYTLILLGGLSIYNMVVSRIFFQTSIPEELYEAARVDGGSNYIQFFSIALPLSKPIIAVMILFYAVDRWNDYFTALIYVTDSTLFPLQVVLRNILISNQALLGQVNSGSLVMDEDQLAIIIRNAYLAESMKYSLIFIASAPMLIAYPFVQKHFIKGVMIGSLKG